MSTPELDDANKDTDLWFTVLKSLAQFDEMELRGVVRGICGCDGWACAGVLLCCGDCGAAGDCAGATVATFGEGCWAAVGEVFAVLSTV
jgi:hypothetical protein